VRMKFFSTSVFYALLLFYRRRSRCPRAVYRMKNCPTAAAVSHLRHRTGSPLGGDKSASAESHVLDIRTHTYNTCIRIIYIYILYIHTHVHTEANSIMCTQCGPQIAVLERPPLARTKGSGIKSPTRTPHCCRCYYTAVPVHKVL